MSPGAKKPVGDKKPPPKKPTGDKKPPKKRADLPPVQQAIFDEGAADAAAGRKPTPPDGGPLADAYMAGFESVPGSSSDEPAADKKKKPAKKAPAAKKAPKRRKAPAPARRAARQAQGQLLRPIERQTASALATVAMVAVIAVLYNLITHAGTTATVIDRLVAAVSWLDRPSPIPYRTPN